ncbi:MAG TPA: alpha/beta hydrolase-fold protein [Cyclobacteriaceae bacterium]|jgi:predicted alpha/beta superfamily hydrolase|nr:alpha/beta hydrolase-fold protein [Cyclobacteriaceae bacterium]
MTARVIIFAFLLLTSCVKRADYDRLKSTSDSLAAKNNANIVIEGSQVYQLSSKYTGQTYDLYISCPINFKQTGKRYPLLVALDAEVNFGAVDYISHRLTKDKMAPELVVVGIAYHGATDEDTYYSIRAKDFTPSEDKEQENRRKNAYRYGSGGAENFVKFLSMEALPFLEKNFPIEMNDRALYGHSFGGLFGAHVLINHPSLFDRYLILSPSLWWNQNAIMKTFKADSLIAKKIRVYVATGSLEDTMVGDQMRMVNHLKQTGLKTLSVKSEILENETHRSIFGRGFTNGMRYLFESK